MESDWRRLALQPVSELRLLRWNEAVEKILFHHVRITLVGWSPASAGLQGDLDPVARRDRRVVIVSHFIAALTHHEQLGLRAAMAAAMDSRELTFFWPSLR